ncbi:MAG: DUF2207 domain-containing protein [Parcubacteria group bacterium]
MKKIFFFFGGLLLLAPIFSVRAEEIKTYDVDMTINADATVDVAETIQYDYGTTQRHGIYRDVPVKYTNATNDNRTITLDHITVADQYGVPYTFVTARDGDNLQIKIGNADKFVTGMNTYVITYTVTGAINYFDDHDELYWNATGDRWSALMKAVQVTVHAPQISKTACFAGPYGSTVACDDMITNNDRTVTFAQENLVSGSGVTTVIGMPAGTVYKPTLQQKIVKYLMDNWIFGLPVFVLIVMWRLWYTKGRDPEGKGTIVPYYEAPEGLTAAEVGMIAEDAVAPKSVSAAIIQLAVNGHLTIKKIDKKGVFSSEDYEFTQTGKSSADVSEQDKLLFDAIFGGAQTRRMSDLKEKFYKDLVAIKKSIEGAIMQKGYYTGTPSIVRATYVTIGIFLIVGSFIAGSMAGLAYGIATFLSSVIILSFGIVMPQRTKNGAIVREQVLGLKLYMETAEKDRINFHNAPEKNLERFEKLLPYAMVLGVEEAWAKQFEDIYKTKPQWYESGDATFSPILFAHSLHAFSDANNATMVSQPSSAGSGGSGFSGGGSGGGFGGGGGGSW